MPEDTVAGSPKPAALRRDNGKPEVKEIITINNTEQPLAQRLTQHNQGHSEKTNLRYIVLPPETYPWVRRNY